MSKGAPAQAVDAVVVGAGFSGLYMMYKLRELGFSRIGFERGADVGGTWYWNRYPGARCDIESMLYAYSFDEDLVQEWEWTEKYPAQPEILRYIEHVADRYDLRSDFVFDTRVVSATFDEDSSRWLVRTDTGDEVVARFLITAVGVLSKPKDIDIPGIDTFGGRTYHTARWPQDGVDFSGQRVGVIGTGSSGIQVIPILAQQAAELTVFQRTPSFTLPARNRPIDPGLVEQVRSDIPAFREAAQRSLFGISVPGPKYSALEVTAEERTASYDATWERGHLIALLSTYRDLLTSREANETAAEYVRGKIREIVRDPAVAERLTPHGYAIGAKRPCLDTDYYETYNRDNVALVDLKAEPVISVTERGVRTEAGEYELDCLVFATGFDAITGALLDLNIRGRGGLALKDAWADGPITYLGVSVAQFPNLFTILGPGSPSVLSNLLVSIEQHVDWISEFLSYLEKHGLSVSEATDAAARRWTDHVQQVASGTLYPETPSWFTGSNVAGKPRIFMPYVGGVGTYRAKCAQVAQQNYAGFELS